MADPTDPTDWEKANRGKAQDAYTRAGQAAVHIPAAFDDAEGIGLGEERPKELVRHGMSGAIAGVATKKRAASQREVALIPSKSSSSAGETPGV